eukprot:CAMPEP_0170169700 /NCGR_PEP_ID=MMETSP0040_2-20121228/2641_1 /TAXON_ID=641309 /ORGANISM="Lotharella oceanica, Strain CCMP622" /LENGTH=82 /DNA_ID=CAMNT_0010408609 /DNA_START=192 /DNA_END=440 /DNA_ORIENTATION=-
MAEFGTIYVRDEWKKHKDAEPEHLKGFFEEWMHYLQVLISNGGGAQGVPNSTLDHLSEEQQEQLDKLRDAVIADFDLIDKNE